MSGSEGRVGLGGEDGSEVVDYRVSASVLEAIVRWSLAGDDRLRLAAGGVRGVRHAITVSVDDGSATVVVHIRGRLGEDLLELGARVKQVVATRLGVMTGLGIARVDVHVVGVFRSGEVDA